MIHHTREAAIYRGPGDGAESSTGTAADAADPMVGVLQGTLDPSPMFGKAVDLDGAPTATR